MDKVIWKTDSWAVCSDVRFLLFAWQCGVRALPPKSDKGRLPIMGRVDEEEDVWAFVGLGARGLLYHAYVAFSTPSTLQNPLSPFPYSL